MRTVEEVDAEIDLHRRKRDSCLEAGGIAMGFLALEHQNNIDTLVEEKRVIRRQ